jgi:hypothetical protein
LLTMATVPPRSSNDVLGIESADVANYCKPARPTRSIRPHLEHEKAKAELKNLVPLPTRGCPAGDRPW